jgi:5'-3' exonuclease
MINILCDGNYIFHKTFGIFSGYGNVDPAKVLGKKSDQAMFIRKVSTDLCAALKSLPSGGRLIFTADSRSWRRDIEIEDGGYKSNRVKNENVDWTIFFQLLEEFGIQLEKMGFIFSKVPGAEGDDLLYAWSKKLNEAGEDCIIISGDKDLHQLTRLENNNWTITWNNNNKKNVLTVPQNWESGWLLKEEDASIFNMGSSISPDKERLKSLVSKCETNEVDRYQFILNKMFIGDKGDAVPSVWEVKSGGKTNGFTPKKSETLIQSIAESEWSSHLIGQMLENESFVDWTSGCILRLMKDIDSKDNRAKVSKNILRNYKLMWLDDSVIPSEVMENMLNEVSRGLSIEKRNITLDRIKILEGTNWVSQTYQPSTFDPFADL